MPRIPRARLHTAASVAAVTPPATGRVQVPDAKVRGLALRVAASGQRSWVLRYVAPGAANARIRTLSLADLPETQRRKRGDDAGELLSLAEARAAATSLRARLDAGESLDPEPVPLAPTLAAVAPRWLEVVSRTRSASTHSNYRTAMHKHVLPHLGTMRVAEVQRVHVAALHEAMRDTPIAANRTLAALGVFFAWCEVEGSRPAHTSPVYGIGKYAETRRQRFLTHAELVRLGAVLATAEREGLAPSPAMARKAGGMSSTTRAKRGTRPARPTPYKRETTAARRRPADPFAVASLRLMLLTGWRMAEIVATRWADVDLAQRVVIHRRTKGGSTARPLSAPAATLLASLPRVAGSPWVFPAARDATKHAGKPVRLWDAVRFAAGFFVDDKAERVMSHDLRHSVGAVAATSGASLATIASLLGHKQVSTTERYSHLHRDARHEVADTTAGIIADALAVGAAHIEVEASNGTAVTPIGRARRA